MATPMKRLAYLSPLNPAPSGIADYSEELLPYLAQYADVTVYHDNRLKPSNPLLQCFVLRRNNQLERDHAKAPYDAIIYHMGNSPVHAQIWTLMQQFPGVLVLHESVLHHFMLNYMAVVQGDLESYRREARERYGAEGARIAELMLHGRFTEAAFTLPFSERVVASAQGVIAHSQFVAEQVKKAAPAIHTAIVPMGVPLPPAIPRDDARTRLGLPTDAPVLASFGHINPYKRLQPMLRTVRLLRDHYPAIRYVLVGSVSPNFDVQALAQRAGVADAVTVTGYVSRGDFEDYVAAADICVNLRHPTAGETSASLLRLLGAGKPTLVTASGSFSELPPDVAAQVDPDSTESDLLLGYCHLLLARPDVAAALGTRARQYVATNHTPEGAAAGYMRFLEQQFGWDTQRTFRQPMWIPAATSQSRLQAARFSAPPHSATAASTAQAPAPATAAAFPQPIATLGAQAGAALADLGAGESDATVLRRTAEALRDLLGDEQPDEN